MSIHLLLLSLISIQLQIYQHFLLYNITFYKCTTVRILRVKKIGLKFYKILVIMFVFEPLLLRIRSLFIRKSYRKVESEYIQSLSLFTIQGNG